MPVPLRGFEPGPYPLVSNVLTIRTTTLPVISHLNRLSRSFILSFTNLPPPFPLYSTQQVKGARNNRLQMCSESAANGSSGVVTSAVVVRSSAGNRNRNLTAVAERRRQTANEGPRLTIMLITVSFTFLLLTLPNNISLIVTFFWNSQPEIENVSYL